MEGSFKFDVNKDNQVLFHKHYLASFPQQNSLRLWYVNGQLRATVAGADASNNVVESNLIVDWQLEVGRWVHMAVTFDDANRTLSIFVDGQMLGTLVTNVHLGYDQQPMQIGYERFNPFLGSVSTFRMWNYARSIAEIRATIGRHVNSDAQGLTLDYAFRNGDSLTIEDGSLRGNHGRKILGWLPTNNNARPGE